MNYLFSLLVLLIISGCVLQPASERFPEVAARQLPAVQLGTEFNLIDKPVLLRASLSTKDNRVHLVVVDADKAIYHLLIHNEAIEKRELIGKLISKSLNVPIDLVEDPAGGLRVLVGDTQYVKNISDSSWREIKGNRCIRFLRVGDKLYCGFVSIGKDLNSPKRKDYTFGFFVLVPIVYWSNEQASKLVLAEESNNGWIVRAVVDPDIILDANPDFLLDIDNKGYLHILYNASRGGGAWAVLAGGLSMGGGVLTIPPEMRHARISVEQLLSNNKAAQASAITSKNAQQKWLAIQGSKLPDMPFVDFDCQQPSLQQWWTGPLHKSFSLNVATGDIWGLARIMKSYGWDGCFNQWIVFGIKEGYWLQRPEIVATHSLPTDDYKWFFDNEFVLRSDIKNNSHLLLQSCVPGLWEVNCNMIYLKATNQKWSAPLLLGRANNGQFRVRSLTLGASGNVFAAWTNESNRLVGRWIKVH